MARTVAVLKNTLLAGADGLLFNALRTRGDQLALFAFDRGADESPGVSRWRGQDVPQAVVVDGVVPPRSIAGRIGPLRRMARALKASGLVGQPAEVAVAGSSELAILMHLLGVRARHQFYLLADLTWFHRTRGVRHVVAWLERRCIAAGWTPVLTSPAFHRTYFGPLGFPIERFRFVYNAETHLDWRPAEATPCAVPPRTLLWSGMLRCPRSLELLSALATSRGDRWSVRLAGKLMEPGMEALADRTPALVRRGPYQPHETPAIVAEGDLLWGCDWSLGENSSALLPNRLFHAVLGRRPIVVSQGSFLERVVQGYDIGLSVPPDAQAIAEALDGITPERMRTWVAHLDALAQRLRTAPAGWSAILDGRAPPLSRDMVDGRVFG